MRIKIFAGRNFKELIRDPLSLIFCIGLPGALLLIFALLQNSIPVEIFKIESLTPGIIVFSFAFLTLFSSMLISKDRETSFLTRLYSSPMTAFDFISGYALPLFAIALAQCAACFVIAVCFGYPVSFNMLAAVVASVPAELFFVGLGIMLGTLFKYQQVGGICSIIITFTSLLSGIWFDLQMIGGAFEVICNILPFAPAVKVLSAACSGDFGGMFPSLWIVLAYAAVSAAVSVALFSRKMKEAK